MQFSENRRVLSTIIFFSFSLCTYPQIADAYIDLGTGSLIVQALIAAAFGISLTVRIYWHKLKDLFGFGSRDKMIDDEQKENGIG